MNDMIIPMFCSAKLDQTKAFYQDHMGFSVAAEMPGYVELERAAGGPRLAFMSPDVDKWSEASGQGILYCFRVDDADAEHARLASEGVQIVETPSDKPWGERGFLAADPNGITLYLGHLLPNAVESVGSSE